MHLPMIPCLCRRGGSAQGDDLLMHVFSCSSHERHLVAITWPRNGHLCSMKVLQSGQAVASMPDVCLVSDDKSVACIEQDDTRCC
jgi:hypothetical protein